ncbi:hypothetical protein [Salinispora arenicola]|uniref:hypothetical protein n=1 Tax=Salinispora arenicola TaxID=168697 RepID=UPI001E5466AA|nr:hypothetical protein [Salinispora arenicola]
MLGARRRHLHNHPHHITQATILGTLERLAYLPQIGMLGVQQHLHLTVVRGVRPLACGGTFGGRLTRRYTRVLPPAEGVGGPAGGDEQHSRYGSDPQRPIALSDIACLIFTISRHQRTVRLVVHRPRRDTL